MFTIKVVSSSSGKPVSGKRVKVGFEGFTRGMTDEGFTDSNGEVHFNNAPGKGKVFVDHKTVFYGRIDGRIIVYI